MVFELVDRQVWKITSNLDLKAETEEDLPGNIDELSITSDSPRAFKTTMPHVVGKQSLLACCFVSGEPIQFNSAQDIIHIDPEDLSMIDEINAIGFLGDKQYIHFLSIYISSWNNLRDECDRKEFNNAFRCYPNLKEVFFVTRDGETCSREEIERGLEEAEHSTDVSHDAWSKPKVTFVTDFEFGLSTNL